MLGAPGYLGKLQQHSAGAQYFACSKLRPRRERVQSITCQYLLPGSPLQPLHQLINSSHLQELVLRHPELLTAEHSSPVTSWLDFWHEYGLDENAIGKLLLQCPELISCTSIYEAGRTLLFFRHLGWKHEHIRGRIIAQYPQVSWSAQHLVRLMGWQAADAASRNIMMPDQACLPSKKPFTSKEFLRTQSIVWHTRKSLCVLAQLSSQSRRLQSSIQCFLSAAFPEACKTFCGWANLWQRVLQLAKIVTRGNL